MSLNNLYFYCKTNHFLFNNLFHICDCNYTFFQIFLWTCCRSTTVTTPLYLVHTSSLNKFSQTTTTPWGQINISCGLVIFVHIKKMSHIRTWSLLCQYH